MIVSILSMDMPSAVSLVAPGVMAMVGVDPAEGHQVEFLVEHLPVQFITWQAFPATVVEDIQHRCGVLHYAYLQVGVSGHLRPFALWTVFPSSLAGRCPATTTGTLSP